MSFIPTTDLIQTSVTLQRPIGKPSNNSALAPSIVKLSVVLKSSSSKGKSLELKHSLSFHQNTLPILISPSVLRTRQMGQVDLARMIKQKEDWLIEVGEVKSSDVGVEASQRFQKFRLLASCDFLGRLLGRRVKLTKLVG